jgi:hypothetical protein
MKNHTLRLLLSALALAGLALNASAVTNPVAAFATVCWTPPTPGFKLQSTDSLSPTNWITAPTGTNNPTTVPASLPIKFYRLFKP